MFVCIPMSDVLADVCVLDCLLMPSERDDVACIICAGPYVDPVACKEGHMFCRACVKQALLRSPTCPKCRASLKPDALLPVPFMVDEVAAVKVRCSNAAQHTNGARTCLWEGRAGDWEPHLAEDCVYTLVPCLNDGCRERIPRHTQRAHATTCAWRVEQCNDCRELFQSVHRDGHKKTCPAVTVACPREGCDGQFARGDTAAHEATCPMMPVRCEFAECGCPHGTVVELLRHEVRQHSQQAAEAHAKLAFDSWKAAEAALGRERRARQP